MSISYYRPPTNPDGTKMNYEQRCAARKAQEHTKRAPVPIERPMQSYEERKALRLAEKQGQREAQALAEQQEAARKAAELAATPEHLRRPNNVYRDLAEHWRHSSRPEAARRVVEYEKRAAEADRKIDAEMADKLRKYQVESNPETVRAREHLAAVSAGATTPEERIEWARCAGLIEAGASGEYWGRASELLAVRLQNAQSNLAAHREAMTGQQSTVDEAAAVVAQTTQAIEAAHAD